MTNCVNGALSQGIGMPGGNGQGKLGISSVEPGTDHFGEMYWSVGLTPPLPRSTLIVSVSWGSFSHGHTPGMSKMAGSNLVSFLVFAGKTTSSSYQNGS